jgi:hypothetical protein
MDEAEFARWQERRAAGYISPHEIAANERIAEQRSRGRISAVMVAHDLASLNGWTDEQWHGFKKVLLAAVEGRELRSYDPDALEAAYPGGADLDHRQLMRALVDVTELNAWIDSIGAVVPVRLASRPGDQPTSDSPAPSTIVTMGASPGAQEMEPIPARRTRRLARFRALGGDPKKTVGNTVDLGRSGALVALTKEEAAAGRKASDRRYVKDDLVKALKGEWGIR